MPYNRYVTKTATRQNDFSDAIILRGLYNISISGTRIATVTLQRSFDSGTTWLDVDTWAGNSEETGEEPERGVQYRIGIKTGDYLSGSAILRLSQ